MIVQNFFFLRMVFFFQRLIHEPGFMMDEEDRDIDLELDGVVSFRQRAGKLFAPKESSFSHSVICYFYDFLSTRIMTIWRARVGWADSTTTRELSIMRWRENGETPSKTASGVSTYLHFFTTSSH